MRNARKIILTVMGVLIIVSCYFYIGYRIIKVDGRNAVEFENRILPAIKAGERINLKDIAPFPWDAFYYFHAYTPPKQMYEKTGTRWTNNNTFIGYLLFNDMEKEILNDGFYALVFLHKGKVVCHYTGAADKFDFDMETQNAVKAEDAVFRVDYKEVSEKQKYPLLRRQEVKKTRYDDNTGIPVKEEPVEYRIVYDRYIYKVYHLDGWDIRDLCKKTHTEMNVLEGKETPKKFELVRGKVRLTFVGEGDDRTMAYKVFKDGKELKLDYGPHKYRGAGPFIQLDTFLNSLEIRHYTDESTKLVYIDSDKATEVLGEEMYCGEISLAPEDNYEAKVDYDYVKPDDPAYERIRFSLNGNNSFDMTLFDRTKPGSSKSYRDAWVNRAEYEGSCFIQIVLNAQGRSNGDAVVFQYTDGKLEPVFTNADYMRYVSANVMLETDSNGRCTFIDNVNGIKKEVDYKGLPPDSIFPVRQLWFHSLEYEKTDNRLVVVATANAVYEGSPFFEISFEFAYNGTAFIPVKAEALDSKKFIEDKKSGRSIEPLSKYKLFAYDMKAKE